MKIGILGCGSAEAQALIAALMKVEMGDEGQKDRPAVGRILLVEAGGDYGLDFESMKSAIKPAMHESPDRKSVV